MAGYLQVAAWPAPLVFDYGDYPGDMVWNIHEVWPQFLLVSGLGGGSLFALWKWPKLGFPGAWFFVILAPSSSFIPILTQLRAEHRMSLSLAAVLVLAVVVLHRIVGRAALGMVILLALALGGVMRARNNDDQSELRIWADTAKKRPGNARAHHNHGLMLDQAGDEAGAIREYQRAVEQEPDYFEARLNLATALIKRGSITEGRVHLNAAVGLRPRTSNDSNNVGSLFYLLQEYPQARDYLAAAIRLDPENYEAYNNLACLLVAEGRPAEAIPYFRQSIALRTDPRTFFNLGDAYQKTGDAGRPGQVLVKPSGWIRPTAGRPSDCGSWTAAPNDETGFDRVARPVLGGAESHARTPYRALPWTLCPPGR